MANWLGTFALGLALLAGTALVLGGVTGHRVLVISSGSMRPTLEVGDLVVARSVPPERLRVGDIVTFHHPAVGNALVTHRVRQVEVSGGNVRVETRGDANTVSEWWIARRDGSVGLTVWHVPGHGLLLLWLRNRWLRAGLVLGGTGWLIVAALRWVGVLR